MKLAASSIVGEFVVLDIDRCPILIRNSVFAYTKGEGPIMQYNTLVYYNEEYDICETDVVYDKKRNYIGTIVYRGGWLLENNGTYSKFSYDYDKVILRKRHPGDLDTLNRNRPYMPELCYGNFVFSLSGLQAAKDDMIYLNQLESFVPVSDIHIYSMLVDDYTSQALAFDRDVIEDKDMQIVYKSNGEPVYGTIIKRDRRINR